MLKRLKQLLNPPPSEFKELYAIFENSQESKWILGEDEALGLYRLIKNLKPKNILELGSGIGASTAIMALALGDECKITSIEQYEKCVKVAKELIPQNLQRKINFIRSDTYAFQNNKISKYLYFSGYKYINLIRGPFDLVLIDGPGAWLEGNELVALQNGDIINLLPNLSSTCKVYVDGRESTVSFIKRFLSLYLKLVLKNDKYAVFERTEKPILNLDNLEIFDIKLERRKKTLYFKN